MLEITVPENEFYHPGKNMFITIPSCTLSLEHSLISVAKWESKWHVPYLNAQKRTAAQELDYVRCMVIGIIKNDYVFSALSPENVTQIQNYIDDTMTATTFSKTTPQSKNRQIVTAEVLYARMFANNIPMECQKWHLNRLLTLIRVCDTTNSPPTKMSKKQTAARYAEQNALRRAQHNSKG